MPSYNTLKLRERDIQTEERLAIIQHGSRRGGLAGMGGSDDRRTRRSRLAKARREQRHMIREAKVAEFKEKRKAEADEKYKKENPIQYAQEQKLLEALAAEDKEISHAKEEEG